jgi:hypothetical protein
MAHSTLTSADRRHREEFATFARRHGHEPYRPVMERLYDLWEDWNRDYFGDRLIKPHILLAEPRSPRAWGDHAPLSGWGSRNQIRIRPSLYHGSHPDVRPEDEYQEGRIRLVADVLLHETIHQFHDEITGQTERSYHGHGPAFRDECNRIGALLKLPPVRTAKARGKDRGLPSCAHWPMNVRPADYYLGAFSQGPSSRTEEEEPDTRDRSTRKAKPAGTATDLYEVLSGAIHTFEGQFVITDKEKLAAIRMIEKDITAAGPTRGKDRDPGR